MVVVVKTKAAHPNKTATEAAHPNPKKDRSCAFGAPKSCEQCYVKLSAMFEVSILFGLPLNVIYGTVVVVDPG